jgi:predicted negative regulator of RcsB-dependent stress response
MSAVFAFALRHLKWILPMLAILGVLAWGFWQRHEATSARQMLATYKTREAAATERAKREQAQADAEAQRQRAALAAQAASAMAALQAYRRHSKAREAALRGALEDVYRHSEKARAWRDAPVPASVLSAIREGQADLCIAECGK